MLWLLHRRRMQHGLKYSTFFQLWIKNFMLGYGHSQSERARFAGITRIYIKAVLMREDSHPRGESH